MIIPVRCFTCNRVLASKYEKYLELTQGKDDQNVLSANPNPDIVKETTFQQKAFEAIGIVDRYCCKRHIITHIELIEII